MLLMVHKKVTILREKDGTVLSTLIITDGSEFVRVKSSVSESSGFVLLFQVFCCLCRMKTWMNSPIRSDSDDNLSFILLIVLLTLLIIIITVFFFFF